MSFGFAIGTTSPTTDTSTIVKMQNDKQEVFREDTFAITHCGTLTDICNCGGKKTQESMSLIDIFSIALGAILGFICSMGATALYNHCHKINLSIDKHIAKICNGNKTEYSFLLVNKSRMAALNVTAEVAIVYYQGNKKCTDTQKLIKASTQYLAGKNHSNDEDSTYTFTIKGTENFEKKWNACRNNTNTYQNPHIRIRVVSYHAQSGLVSFTQEEFDDKMIQTGIFKNKKFEKNITT